MKIIDPKNYSLGYVYDSFCIRLNMKGLSTSINYAQDKQGIVSKSEDKICYYHYDGLGSVISLTDDQGKTVETYSYDSFGNLKRQGNKTKNSFTYTGRERDKEAGLYYYRNRYYDPEMGRFLTQDPLGMVDGLNLYTYVDSVGKSIAGTGGIIISSTGVYSYGGGGAGTPGSGFALTWSQSNPSTGWNFGAQGGFWLG